MRAEERQQKIEQYLQKVEFASLDELAQSIGVSTSTIRRDLTTLEEAGAARRSHGAVRGVTPHSDEFAFNIRDTHQVTEKEAIGRACAELIQPNQSVIIDVGTTPFHVARYLESKKPQIITNSLPVANLYASSSMVEVVVSGGVIYPRLGVLMGPLAMDSFSKIHADVAVMSASGITLDGVTNSHGLLIEIQRTMIRGAQKVIFCLDHTKFGRRSMSALCSLDEIDILVTDHAAPKEILDALLAYDIEVIQTHAPS